MTVTGDTWTIDYGDGRQPITLTASDVVIRIWLPSPAKQIEADSPFRSLLPILSEIEWLTRHVFAQITSRLAGAGILMMPQSMTFPPPPAPDGQEVVTANDAESFMLALADAMLKPIEDPGSPSAMVPIVVTAPDDAIDKARLLTFWSELDAQSLQLRNEAIRRFALGMDLPPEQILGIGVLAAAPAVADPPGSPTGVPGRSRKPPSRCTSSRCSTSSPKPSPSPTCSPPSMTTPGSSPTTPPRSGSAPTGPRKPSSCTTGA